MKDDLYILRPGFQKNAEGSYYCGDSVAVEGLLSFFPELRDLASVHYIAASRPRADLVGRIGEANQSAPVLILAEGIATRDASIAVKTYGTARFVDTPDVIRRCLSSQYGVAEAA